MTITVPAPEIERSSWIPWIVLICSSSFCATWVSTSSVDAPGSTTRTLTVGRSMENVRVELPGAPTEEVTSEENTSQLQSTHELVWHLLRSTPNSAGSKRTGMAP